MWRLAIRARTAGLTAGDVDRAFDDERSLVVSSLNRGALHLVRRADDFLLPALATPPLFAGDARRLGREGVTPAAAERSVAVVERSLVADGPLTRRQLSERIARADAAKLRADGEDVLRFLGWPDRSRPPPPSSIASGPHELAT